jgi:hypothetical protein
MESAKNTTAIQFMADALGKRMRKPADSASSAQAGAVLSECGQFRYRLWRRWDQTLPILGYVMLNPSTADATEDDQTIRKCVGFARRLGYGSIEVVNLFAYRAREPADLKAAGYPVGEYNDQYIASVAADTGGRVICAWGSNVKGLGRPGEVLNNLRRLGATPMALHMNAGGIPAHPVLLPYSCIPKPF